MIGDAWEELSGYDGRLARTFRMLVRRHDREHPTRILPRLLFALVPLFAGIVALFSLAVLIYTLLAFRTVYRESWSRVLVKGAGIAGLYWVVGIIRLTATFAWIVVMRR